MDHHTYIQKHLPLSNSYSEACEHAKLTVESIINTLLHLTPWSRHSGELIHELQQVRLKIQKEILDING